MSSRHLLVFSIFIVASCGLAYELIAGALSSYLLGDSVLQFSSVIGCYLFAMGVGSHFSKYIPDKVVLERFVDVELLVGLLGGLSAGLLFVAFAWMAAPFRTLLYVFVFLIGLLIGMEIPLVMRALNQHQIQFSELVSRVLTFDYLGALAVSLLFPLFLAPRLGLTRTGLLFGMLNVAVAMWTIWVFRQQLGQPASQFLRACCILLVLTAGMVYADRLVQWAERGLFGDEVIHASNTPYQRLVLTRWKDDLRLYINGNLQFSSRDEYRYHEALVHPALTALPAAQSVLILGGGDGLALREVLKYGQVRQVTLVDLDQAMTDLFSHSPPLTALNQDSFHDPRVQVINADAAQWLQNNQQMYDLVIADFPDPSSFALGKLYSVPFYRLLQHHVAANGLVVIQSTSPYYAPHAFWSVDATLQEAGFRTYPYHAYVPSFGEWGFIIGATQQAFVPPVSYRVPLRFLNEEVTRQMFYFSPDMPSVQVEPNRLNTQSLVHYFEADWRRQIR